MVDIIDLKRRLEIGSFKEQWPDLFDSIRESQEAVRRAMSGPTIVDLHQEQREQLIASAQREISSITKKVQPIISDKKE